jgi:hypothetical protein
MSVLSQGVRPSGMRRCVMLVVLLASLAACSSVPPAPLMSPIAVARDHGYAETPVGDNRFAVTYIAPTQRTYRDLASRGAVTTAERSQAFDLAVWRAAQIALAQGYRGFRVTSTRSNTNAFSDNNYDPFFGPWYGPGGFPRRGFWGGPYGPYWGPPPDPYSYVQTEVTIDVTMLHDPAPGDYDAQSAIEQMRRTYPGAEGPPPAPAG